MTGKQGTKIIHQLKMLVKASIARRYFNAYNKQFLSLCLCACSKLYLK